MGENSSFLERLRSMEEGPVESTALEKHLGRLRKGQEWLNQDVERYGSRSRG